MRPILPALTLLFIFSGSLHARGLLIPVDRAIPPLAMVDHQVTIAIEDQAAVTRVEQTFRNHTHRPLEATYIFPVPKGAGVRKFTMWVNGREVPGELVEADKARQIYTDIVRRTQDPGLLEYMGNNLMRMRVFPVPPRGDQKVALSYTSIAARDEGLVEYVYPLKTDGRATQSLEKFSIQATVKSQHPILSVYSPTHSISCSRPNDREAIVNFDRNQTPLDRDFQLYYAVGDQDVGLTALTHRPISSENGYFMLLLSPRVQLAKEEAVPRDMVFVLDTSGSMHGVKMDQAKKALKFCLGHLAAKDRFGVMNFATTVNKYADHLTAAQPDAVEQARKWVDQLEAVGGTAINDALAAALEMRSSDTSRSFTVVFFTDGMPTVGETNPEKILKSVTSKNTASTRIFTFGVGDDVNATMLDQLADQTRAVSTYVRPAEDIEVKLSGLYAKITHPVMTNLKLSVPTAFPVGESQVRLLEMYPPQIPDLFHGGQVVVLGRYAGHGSAALKLTGNVGKETREFDYGTVFTPRSAEDKSFVEQLWARRKVGYLLDQIRANGETKELVEETVKLAKKYGIATPYTSYLIVPDAPMPVIGVRGRAPGLLSSATPFALAPLSSDSEPQKVAEFAKNQGKDLGQSRDGIEEKQASRARSNGSADAAGRVGTLVRKKQLAKAQPWMRSADRRGVQSGKLGVDLSIESQKLRNQERLSPTATRRVAGRNCLEIGGVWIDEGFDSKMPMVAVKSQSDAYFRILERHAEIKEVLQLGNYLVWVAPSGAALVIDAGDGKEKLSDAEIDKLFQPKTLR